MKRLLGLGLVLLLFVITAPTATTAQTAPEILTFELIDIDSVRTVNAIEDGSATATIAYEVTGLNDGDTVTVLGRVGREYVPLLETGLTAEVGVEVVPLVHPLDFEEPGLRLVILNSNQRVVAAAELAVPYVLDPEADVISITTFTADVESLDANALAQGDANFAVTWAVANRLPETNLRFIQVYDNRFSNSVEAPRRFAYVTSSGSGIVAPRYQQGMREVRIVVQVFDLAQGDILAAASLRVPVMGEPSPPPTTTTPAPPTATPPPQQSADANRPPQNPSATPSIPLQDAEPIAPQGPSPMGAGAAMFGPPDVVDSGDLADCAGDWFFATQASRYTLTGPQITGAFTLCPALPAAEGPAAQQLELSQRLFVCGHCGLTLDRDHNAAINIRAGASAHTARGEVRLSSDSIAVDGRSSRL